MDDDDDLLEMPTDVDRVLAVVAHPDDLEYGASAAIAVWTDAGQQVAYLLATRGEAGIDGLDPAECGPRREAEQIEAARCVGVDDVTFLDHHDGVIEAGLGLRRDIAAAIRRHRPQLVLTLNHHDTWFGQHWNSPDHRAVGRTVFDAVGDAGNRWIFPELVDEGLEPWGGVRWVAVSGSHAASHAVAVASGMERAVASLQAHATYLDGLGQTPEEARTLLTSTARSTGERFGGRLATAFELVAFG